MGKAMDGLIQYIELVANGTEKAAISAYTETIDSYASEFYQSLKTKSGSSRLNNHIEPINKVNTLDTSLPKKQYGYKIDWSHDFITSGSKTTWHDLAYILNYGHGARISVGQKGTPEMPHRVLGNYFIKNAQRRLRGLDKKAYTEYKAKMRKVGKDNG